jgi:hypothetical protein
MEAAECGSTTAELGVINTLLDLEEFEVVQVSADRKSRVAEGSLPVLTPPPTEWEVTPLCLPEIVSNQPSTPAENRTRYAIDEHGQLVLELDGSKSWYRRPSGGAG